MTAAVGDEDEALTSREAVISSKLGENMLLLHMKRKRDEAARIPVNILTKMPKGKKKPSAKQLVAEEREQKENMKM